MDTWETCVATALVGSDRQSPQIDLQHPAMRDYAAQLQTQSPPHQILSSAGLLTLYQQVGIRPASQLLPELAPAPDCDLAVCAPTTAQQLSLILAGHHRSALPELLSLLAQANQTIPAELLPLLLKAGQGSQGKRLQAAIVPVLGVRGRWLAQQNPDWDYACGLDLVNADLAILQDQWETGDRVERRTALSQWRHQQPRQAREALIATWKQETAYNRTTWLQTLATNLSLEDEPFLEQALSDRSQAVREMAAELLSQLIGSQHMQRMTAWVQSYVQIQSEPSGFKIVIQPPHQFEPAWAEAGLSEKPKDAKVKGAAIKSWWLQQLIMSADLSLWGEPVSNLAAALAVTNKHQVVLQGLAIAAQRQNRSDWLIALLLRASQYLSMEQIRSMIQQLPKEQEDWLSSVLVQISSRQQLQTLLESLRHNHQGWSLESSRALLVKVWSQIHSATPQDQYHYYGLASSFQELCYCLAVEILPHLRDYLSQLLARTEPVYGEALLQTCIDILEFRQSLQAPFQLSPPQQQVKQTHDPPLDQSGVTRLKPKSSIPPSPP